MSWRTLSRCSANVVPCSISKPYHYVWRCDILIIVTGRREWEACAGSLTPKICRRTNSGGTERETSTTLLGALIRSFDQRHRPTLRLSLVPYNKIRNHSSTDNMGAVRGREPSDSDKQAEKVSKARVGSQFSCLPRARRDALALS